jgi:hypothetical protein
VANWEVLGEFSITNNWIFFEETFSEIFRVTTTITNQEQWDKWLFRSGAYLRLIFPTGERFRDNYIKVSEVPTIYNISIPASLKDQGYVIRTPTVRRASRYAPYTPDGNFAPWTLKLEGLLE